MPDYGLSNQQLEVICALSSGVNVTTAAEQAGVHRNTIANWRRNSLPFQNGFAHAQYDRALYFREKLEDLFDLAIQALRDILADPKASPSVRLKAILTITGIATIPPVPKKQVQLDIEKITMSRAPAQTVTPEAFAPASEMPNFAQPDRGPNGANPNPSSPHSPSISPNFAQPDQPANAPNFAQSPSPHNGNTQ